MSGTEPLLDIIISLKVTASAGAFELPSLRFIKNTANMTISATLISIDPSRLFFNAFSSFYIYRHIAMVIVS